MPWSCGRGNGYVIRLLAKVLGGKVVLCNDGAFADRLTAAAIGRHRRFWMRAVSAVYTPGKIGRTYFRRLGYEDEQIFNSYFSHDVEFFTSERISRGIQYRIEMRKQLGIPERDFVILNISRLLGLKRLEDLHSAIILLQKRSLPNVHIVLIGNGQHMGPVAAMKRDCNNIHFHWIKGVDYKDMPKYYAMSDVLVFPSEGDIWGLVVNEALSMGKPVICTKRIGAAELVRDGENGFVVPVRAPAELADRIERLYRNRALLAHMSKTALDICKRWNTDLAVKSLKNLVHYVLN